MAAILTKRYTTGLTLYGVLFDANSGWPLDPGNESFSAWNSALWAGTYAVAMSELSGSSGLYQYDFGGIVLTGNFLLFVFQQAGGSPALSDTCIGEGMVALNVGSLIVPASNSQATNIQGRIPAALVSGRIDASVGAMQGNVLTAAALAADAASEIAAAKFDQADGVEVGLTERQALRLIVAALAGKVSGATGGAATEVFRSAVADDANRISATVDASGNRTAITYDLD